MPKPAGDVPECLSGHPGDAAACAIPAERAVDAPGLAAERTAAEGAGAAYVDVGPWLCAASACPAVVAGRLVYRDDNHLTTSYAAWLAPVLGARLDEAVRAG